MRPWTVTLAVTVIVAGVVAVLVLVAIGADDDTSIVDLETGDCFDLPDVGDEDDVLRLETVEVVDCDDPHEAEVVASGTLNPDRDREYPSDEELFAEIDRRCAVDAVVPPEFGVLPVAPDAATWETFEGRFACVALRFGGGAVTGSIVDGATSDGE